MSKEDSITNQDIRDLYHQAEKDKNKYLMKLCLETFDGNSKSADICINYIINNTS